MARRSNFRPCNPITRDKIKRCRECEAYKICTIQIANIKTSPYCLYNAGVYKGVLYEK